MPVGWSIDTDDLLARYAAARIDIVGTVLVAGPLVR
jgi:hypothetical protein